MIFSQKELVFLSCCSRNFSNVLKCRFHFENLFRRRTLFWLTLPLKNFIVYKESILHWHNCKGGIKIEASAVNLAWNFMKFYLMIKSYLVSISFFHEDWCTNARVQVINARTRDKTWFIEHIKRGIKTKFEPCISKIEQCVSGNV